MKKILLIIGIIICSGAFAAGDKTITSKTYVDTQVATKQDTIPAVDTNTVLTHTGVNGNIGEKAIYDSTGNYAEQQTTLMTAGTANTGINNALENEFICIDEDTDGTCLIWKIKNSTESTSSKNLFDKNNRERIYGWFPYSGAPWTYVTTAYANRIPCKSNTVYTASYHGNMEQAVMNFGSTPSDLVPTAEHTTISCTNSIRLTHPTQNTPVTITTGPNDKWLIIQYNIENSQNIDMANNLQIEEGSTATEYEPYKNLYIPQNE